MNSVQNQSSNVSRKASCIFRDGINLAGFAKTDSKLISNQRHLSENLISPFASCVTYGKLTHLSKPLFSHLLNGIIPVPGKKGITEAWLLRKLN